MTIRDLLRNALRMRPDRIVIGEVRGPEALDLLTALNTGHDGALSTVHANSPADALARLETLALMAGVGLPHDGDRRAGAARHRPRRPARAAAPTAPAGSPRSPRWRRRRDRGRVGRRWPRRSLRRRRRRRWSRSRRARRCCASPAVGALAAAGARAAAAGRPRGLRALEPASAAGWPLLGAGAALLGGWFLAGPTVALPLAVAGPALAGWAIVAAGARRYRRGGRARAARGRDRDRRLAHAPAARCAPRCRAAAASLDGPPAVELARLGAELELGAPTAEAVEAWRRRMRSARVDAFAAALLSQRLAGGDLAGLLRRFAAGAAERDRVAEDARSATAQARFTGLLVVAMPSGGALFAELLQPGLPRQAARSPASAVLLALAAALQLVGFVAIRRSRPGPPPERLALAVLLAVAGGAAWLLAAGWRARRLAARPRPRARSSTG